VATLKCKAVHETFPGLLDTLEMPVEFLQSDIPLCPSCPYSSLCSKALCIVL